MDLQIRGNDVDITEQIELIANRHAARVERWAGKVDNAKLELRRVNQRSSGDLTAAQITVQSGRSIIRAEERDREPTKAIDSAFEKLESQLRKRHSKRTDHAKPSLAAQADLVSPSIDEDEDDQTVIVRTKRFPVKPMDSDEAIEQMELLGHDFFLFDNLDAKVISVVYRRRDGSYGLLVPEAM
jgi:putative sigma-54 modulation protein